MNQTAFSDRSVKGQTRMYRKTLRDLDCPFPRTGAFHVENGEGFVLLPDAVRESTVRQIVAGPVPQPKPQPLSYYGDSGSDPLRPDRQPVEEIVFCKRIVREPKTEGDKRRIDYRPVRNPKSGEKYWVKMAQPTGKNKWVEVDYSTYLHGEVA